MILATYAIPEVAAVNGLVADRHLCICVLCIYRFARARFTTVSVLEAAGGGGWWRVGIGAKPCRRRGHDLFAPARPPSRKPTGARAGPPPTCHAFDR